MIEVNHLTKQYGDHTAVSDLSFTIEDGQIYGFLGPNGAGKSTTMNIICGVLNQTQGDVFINGVNLRENPVEAKKNIGFLPQQPPLYTDLTVGEYLRHAALLRLVEPDKVDEAVDVALEKCSITHFRDRLIKNLSGGYQQRVGIAQAIVHNPQFVVLDEPTNGLDPNQIVDIRNLIRDIAKHHAVLLSTHILSEVQAICDNIYMIESGKLVFSGTMEEFDNYVAPESFIVEFANSPSKEVLENLTENNGIEALEDGSYRIFLKDDISITEKYIQESVKQNWNLKNIYVERASLSEIFAQLSGKAKNKQYEKVQ